MRISNNKIAAVSGSGTRLDNEGVLQDHPVEVALFNKTGVVTFVWLIIRLYLGWQWAQAGWEKLQNPKWMDGTSLLGFWKSSASSFGQPHSQVSFDWYAGFLNNLISSNSQSWFAPLVAFGEFLGGIALILGLFTGVAAFLLAFMNFNFMLSGSAGVNPLYFVLGLLLVMAWKNAGWWGLDRFVLPALGTPWHRGTLLRRRSTDSTGSSLPTDTLTPASVRVSHNP